MDTLLESLSDRINNLKREHEKAKKEFLSRKLNHKELADLIKDHDFSNLALFTSDNIRKSLCQHETLNEFPQSYNCSKHDLATKVREQFEREIDEIGNRVRQLWDFARD